MLFLNLPLANLSFLVFQQESNNLIPGAFIPPPFPPSLHPLSTQLSFLFLFFQAASTCTFCFTIDNIPDGAPLLATHRQINRSNNTLISSNYALIRPERTQLATGREVAVMGELGINEKSCLVCTFTHLVVLLFGPQS